LSSALDIFLHILSSLLDKTRKSRKALAFKNSKILFKSPNVYFAIAFETWRSTINKGNIGESFFASQLAKAYPVHSSSVVDLGTLAFFCL